MSPGFSSGIFVFFIFFLNRNFESRNDFSVWRFDKPDRKMAF